MKKHLLSSALFALALLAAVPGRAQLFVDSMYHAPDLLVMDFFNGSCVDISNVKFFGKPDQVRFFEGSQSGIGVNAGIIIVTGDAQVAVGPNNKPNAQGDGVGTSTPDEDLKMLSGSPSVFDRAKLHFKMVPRTDSVSFQYVFASEEYCEFVGTNYNDAFGFWIKGPGISGPFNGAKNIATIGDSNIYVTINNVNHSSLPKWYVNNTPGSMGATNLCGMQPSTNPLVNFVQFDGMTTVLNANTSVMRDSTYEVWIAIGDIFDANYDSGIFLSIESLCGDSLLDPVTNFLVVPSGNTVHFANHTRYATAWHWDFGDGSTSTARFPEHTYADLSKQYTVRLIATNYCCADTSYSLVGTSPVAELLPADFKIYPTQMQHQLTVEPSDIALAGSLALTDLSGKTLLHQPFSGKTTLDTSHLPKGAYLLNIQTADGRRLTRKLVK